MHYDNEFIDKLVRRVSLDPGMYANVQAHNAAEMLRRDGRLYRLFGVYWWAVKDALRKYVDDGEWYCGSQDDPLMRERAWHGGEFRTMVAAMFRMNENPDASPDCEWPDANGDGHPYTLYDPDAGV